MNLLKLGSFVLMTASLAQAQEKLTVPLSNPSQPATVKVHLMSGSITVTAGTAPQVIVETSGRQQRRETNDAPAGMHRLDVGRSGLDVQEDHNEVSIGTGNFGSAASITIQVPANSSLQLKTITGHIDVTGVNGEIDAGAMTGGVTLRNVAGSVVASTQTGEIVVSLDRVAPDKPMSFTSMTGRIDVTLPASTKARLRLKTETGSVFSDFDVKMEPDASKPVVEDARGNGGKYRIRMERSVYGSINGGGPEYRFETMSGGILIHKK